MHFTIKSIHNLMKSSSFVVAALSLASRQLDYIQMRERPMTLALYQFTIQLLLCNGSSDGIVKASFWAFARIDVWAAIISSKATLIPTESWVDDMSIDSILVDGDLDDYCNLPNLIFARIVNLLSAPQEPTKEMAAASSKALLGALWDEMQKWYHLPPTEVCPLLRDFSRAKVFPEVMFTRSSHIIIIGGGVSGMGMAVQLKRLLAHDNFTIYDKSDNLGGTWWHNRYPACACDIPSHFYSYSFALKHDWTTMFPGGDELHAFAERFNILPTVASMLCNTISGEVFKREAFLVVSTIGNLDRPAIPAIKGADSFNGEMFHSAEWKDNFKPDGKNIVVVGNGASATQFVPELVKSVGPKCKVTQRVRSSHWWTKRGNPPYSETFKLAMKYVPLAARLYRAVLASQLEDTFFSFYMDSNGAARRQKIKEATYLYIEEAAPAKYREILNPDYEPGCKRRVNTATYLSCLHSPQLELTKDAIVRIGPDYVETKEGKRTPADAIIYATGFQTQKWLFPMEIKGIGGKDLYDVYNASGGAGAYKGTVVTGFPNFFILYGPNAASGQHSIIFHSECQFNYSFRLLHPVLKGNTDSIMVNEEAQGRDLSWVHEKLQHLVFNSGCQSWWMDPLTNKNTFIYPDPMYKYWLRTIFARWSDFDLRKSGRSPKRYFVLGSLAIAAVIGYTTVGVRDVGKLSHQASTWVTHQTSWQLGNLL
ncbi:hypothetical protein BJX99DRAFT_262682 [Aspergillus californicus]